MAMIDLLNLRFQMIAMETNKLFENIWNKSNLKQDIYNTTFDTFKNFKKTAERMAADYKSFINNKRGSKIPFQYNDKGDFEFEITFGGDVLIFLMHSNIFEFPKHHEIMSTHYIKEDKRRSYCGLIHIYNFLADSFRYQRENDAGYLIGRLMVNKEKHYYIEGKKEIGTIYHNFAQSVLDNKAIENIIENAIEYTLNFDLLIPPYEKVSRISILDILKAANWTRVGTEKRLGFKFQADKKEVKGSHD
jgi:hypothetical protein